MATQLYGKHAWSTTAYVQNLCVNLADKENGMVCWLNLDWMPADYLLAFRDSCLIAAMCHLRQLRKDLGNLKHNTLLKVRRVGDWCFKISEEANRGLGAVFESSLHAVSSRLLSACFESPFRYLKLEDDTLCQHLAFCNLQVKFVTTAELWAEFIYLSILDQ